MSTTLTRAGEDDVGAVVALRNAVADDLTAKHGIGHWSSQSTDRGIRADMKRSSIFLLRENDRAVATLQLQTKKPWAIDRQHFTPVVQPLYLLGMAVDPAHQRRGLGRRCIEDAVRICAEWPAHALCLDAYDADAGAGEFYRRCGFTEVGRATYRNTSRIYFELLITG
jgi:GNAT superfamily N-acetyltransferase